VGPGSSYQPPGGRNSLEVAIDPHAAVVKHYR